MTASGGDIIILGAAGTGREVLGWLRDGACGGGRGTICFLDDDPQKWQRQLDGALVLGPLQAATQHLSARFVDALGGPKSFAKRPALISHIPDERFLTLVHPSAHVPSGATLGPGALVFPHVTLGAGAVIGRHVTLMGNSVVNHDAVVGEFSIVASLASLSGGVHLGRCCYVGAGSHVRQGLTIGAGAMLGMGSIVVDEIAPGAVVVGNPARQMSRSGDG
jgi:sugar O-acyltransferase (sialic acid O-acetyltransferase NeuD family)